MPKKARIEKQSSTMNRAERFINKILDDIDKGKTTNMALRLNAFSKYCQFIALKEKIDETEWGAFFDGGRKTDDEGLEIEDETLKNTGNRNTVLDIEKEPIDEESGNDESGI